MKVKIYRKGVIEASVYLLAAKLSCSLLIARKRMQIFKGWVAVAKSEG